MSNCQIPHCRKQAAADKPFCRKHSADLPISSIKVKARSGIEADHAYNDVFPGDIVEARISTLAAEAAEMIFAPLRAALAKQIEKAFEYRQDYVVFRRSSFTDPNYNKFSAVGMPCHPDSPGRKLYADSPVALILSLKDWEV